MSLEVVRNKQLITHYQFGINVDASSSSLTLKNIVDRISACACRTVASFLPRSLAVAVLSFLPTKSRRVRLFTEGVCVGGFEGEDMIEFESITICIVNIMLRHLQQQCAD